MAYKVAVVGATGSVGHEILTTLAERDFPAEEVVALASDRTTGGEVSYGEERRLKVVDLARFDFAAVDIAFFATEAQVSAEFAPRAAKAGAVVIDTSSHFRLDPEVPLVVPEVNPDALAGYGRRNIVATPGSATVALVMALKPLHDLVGIRRAVVATYESTSGAGRQAMDELFTQTRAIYVNDPIRREHFTKQIAFNVIPHIDDFMEDGATREEWSLAAETKKVLDPQIKVQATCVRVPTFIGHAEAVNLELDSDLDEAEARAALRAFGGVVVVDHRADEGYVTPVEAAGEDAVFVSRIRNDATLDYGLSLWIVTDNLRKGTALNAVEIAELLAESYL